MGLKLSLRIASLDHICLQDKGLDKNVVVGLIEACCIKKSGLVEIDNIESFE